MSTPEEDELSRKLKEIQNELSQGYTEKAEAMQERLDAQMESNTSKGMTPSYQKDLEAQQQGNNPQGEGYAEQADARMGFYTGVPDGKKPGELDADDGVAKGPDGVPDEPKPQVQEPTPLSTKPKMKP